MNLNHINLAVDDVKAAHDFLQTYFEMRSLGDNRNMAFLQDENGLVLSLSSLKVSRETELRYPNAFHVGFILENEERVNEMNTRLKADGYDVPPPSRQHGSWTFYFQAPGGFVLEVQS